MTDTELLNSSEGQIVLARMYGQQQVSEQTTRYQSLIQAYREHFGVGNIELFSAPGRCEIGGNHTDHNHGKVLAGSITLDTIAVAAKVEEPVITFFSEGYQTKYVIHLNDLSPQPKDDGTTLLVRGMVAGLLEFGYRIGGFQAYISSNVFSASGLSSSASFEMLICTIISHFYNEGALDAVAKSKIGQYAENRYWNKPSGLLDQMACAYGGLVAIDFVNPKEPIINPVHWNFGQNGYSLVIVNTGGNHADLTDDYAAVPNEMYAVAQSLGASVCRDLSPKDLYANLKMVRETAGDRAVLRALHFFEENKRVDEQVKALQERRFSDFLRLVTESGNSSWKWLQNVYRSEVPREQDVSVALALTEIYLKSIDDSACRVHGGGFAGVILTILPNDYVEEYKTWISGMLGTPVLVVNVREHGAVNVSDLIHAEKKY
ncbi:galactokinase family protein [Paenibacillus kribbensis]|uniref:galactokinase n=1 Tax=Paenibacillus kribbensis TaxID=172713 RepID=UPI002DB59468|nr:galactokinase family protein [Paenibacillus kribbensis]MEC0232998.1 galactokinase family protein [Paenibacillus kribbensis]